MSLLSFSDVAKFYGRQDVLRQATFNINYGDRVGLVGPNGSGKTTILRLLLGQAVPDTGRISKTKGIRIGHLPQDLMTFSGQLLLDMVMDTAENVRAIETELSEIAQALEELSHEFSPDEGALIELTDRQSYLLTLYENLGGYTLESEAKKILQGLGFAERDFERPIDEYSGGWVMRAVLARLLLAGPDLLLLDEPTNHLDLDSLLWLEGYLQICPSAVLLVSHDRTFLNNVVKKIIEIDRGQTVTYHGNYESYIEEREKRKATEAATYAGQQEKIKQIEKFIEKSRVRAATAKRAQSRIKLLEKMDRVEAPTSSDPQTFRLELPTAPRAPEVVVQLENITKKYGSKTVYKGLDLTVRRGDRIAMIGANGRGKSTLMKLLAGETSFQEGRRRMGEGVIPSYFAQFQLEELNPERTVIEELSSVAGDLTTGRLRSILGGFLFKGDDVFKKVAVLSGGERSRLILAKIMLTGPNLLLLDEPSNHLDIPAREMLEQALKQYTGTICLISHDRRLINAVANKVLTIQNGRVEVFPGNFDDYQDIWLEKMKGQTQTKTGRVEKEKSAAGGRNRAEKEARKREEAETRKRLYQQRGPLAKKVEKLEARLAELTAKLDRVSNTLASPGTYDDPEKTKTLNREYAELKADIEQTTAAWEEAALELEGLDLA